MREMQKHGAIGLAADRSGMDRKTARKYVQARRQGVGAALLAAAERNALAVGKWLLVLDTANPDAERLYARRGWQLCGQIPNYALMPDGALCATTILFKSLLS